MLLLPFDISRRFVTFRDALLIEIGELSRREVLSRATGLKFPV